MNSITAFEGLVQFASSLSRDAWQSTVVGCFDWDPFAARLPFEVTMMRQDVQKIVSEAFALADKHDTTSHPLVIVPTGVRTDVWRGRSNGRDRGRQKA